MFTLLSFSVHHKGTTLYDFLLGDETKFSRKKPLTTLIIGENGSGKSYLLSLLAEFFRALHSTVELFKSNLDSSRYDRVRVKYKYQNDFYDVSREGRTWSIIKNGLPARLNDVYVPPRIIALSFMTNDKFVFASEDDPYYKYIGARASSNSSYTSSVRKRVTTSLLNCLREPKKKN